MIAVASATPVFYGGNYAAPLSYGPAYGSAYGPAYGPAYAPAVSNISIFHQRIKRINNRS